MKDFDTWYRANHGTVLAAMVLFCVGEHAQAEDATNDAFVKAYERWHRVATMDSPVGWVTRVAANNVRRSFRRRKRHIELLNATRIESAIQDPEIDPDLWDHLSKLSPRQRLALVLRYVHDLPQQQVADEMEISVGTASATLTHARKNLRRALDSGDQQ